MADAGEDVFGVDMRGWVEQHRSRDPYEVLREPIQNALDTGSDLYVRLDYADRSAVVEDYDPDGVDDLSLFYDLFAGDKHADPEQRGRFGRGIKEFIGASDEALVASTGGAVRFTFDVEYDETAEEFAVDAAREVNPDATRDRGTVVYGTNSDWTRDDLEEAREFVEELWLPEDQQLRLEVYDDHPATNPDARETTVVTHDEPDAILTREYLPTLLVEDGIQVQDTRRTSVEVKKTAPGEGGVYELGIPVTTGEAFPFVFNVQQKVPVTERRNELDNSYREDLMEGLINGQLDLLDDDELAEEYVTQHVSRFAHRTDPDVQQEYIRRRFGEDPDDLLVYTEDTPSIGVAWAVQQGIPTENADEYSDNVGGILESQCRSVEEWHTEMTDDRWIDVVDDPGPEQEALLDYFESEILGRTSAEGITFELALISGGTENGQTRATYSPGEETVYLNALADTWDEPTTERIGTALHELGHHESSATGHGREWYRTVEVLSGEVIQSLESELNDGEETGSE